MFRRILAPVDFESPANGLPACALELASRCHAELHLLYIIPDRKFSRTEGRGILQDAHQRISGASPVENQVSIRRTVQQGNLADAVIDDVRAEQIDLVIVDQTSSGITADRTFKATVNRLIDALECPVLVIRQQALPTNTGSLENALAILRQRFEERTVGNHESTRLEMHEALMQDLRLSHQEADLLFAEMESAKLLQWRADTESSEQSTGAWSIGAAIGHEVVNESIEFQEDQSAAMGLLRRAISSRATDIHIDPGPSDSYRVRFRIDGRVHEYCTMQRGVAFLLMKQLKVMAGVSLSDPFTPSESRLALPASITDYEVRITTAPVVDGEAIALRLIQCDRLYRPLNELGLSPASFGAVYEMLHRRSGLVVIAGPTGGGKTTTAYSMLNVLFTEQQNIISIEDPVELLVPFMRQLNVDKRHGFTMDVALATILRMDPDVLFVGEIRDGEAAQVAIEAAACGKRAFSTMHMRDCSATVTAMRKLDINAKTFADNVSGIITQRLVRRLCAACAESAPITTYEREFFESQQIEAPAALLHPRGCHQCGDTGYKDRIGIFEAVVVDGNVADGIRQDATEGELRQLIRQAGTPALTADGLCKVRDGITSVEEIQEINWLPEAESASLGYSDSSYERGAPYIKAIPKSHQDSTRT